MSGEKCCECGNVLSLEVGIVRCGTLAEGSEDKLYCKPCAPNQGKGYTLADLQRWREDGQAERAKYEMAMMERVGGPDVYFAVKGSIDEKKRRQEQRRVLGRYQRTLQRVVDKLDQLGIVTDDDSAGDPGVGGVNEP